MSGLQCIILFIFPLYLTYRSIPQHNVCLLIRDTRYVEGWNLQHYAKSSHIPPGKSNLPFLFVLYCIVLNFHCIFSTLRALVASFLLSLWHHYEKTCVFFLKPSIYLLKLEITSNWSLLTPIVSWTYSTGFCQ